MNIIRIIRVNYHVLPSIITTYWYQILYNADFETYILVVIYYAR